MDHRKKTRRHAALWIVNLKFLATQDFHLVRFRWRTFSQNVFRTYIGCQRQAKYVHIHIKLYRLRFPKPVVQTWVSPPPCCCHPNSERKAVSEALNLHYSMGTKTSDPVSM